jgi:hypothetical protein
VAAGRFGSDLEGHLRRYGPTVVLLVAKLKDGPRILRRGVIRTVGGNDRPLARDETDLDMPVATIRDLEEVLVYEEHVPRLDRKSKSEGVRPFRVPEDLQAAGYFLYKNLKSLRPRAGTQPIPRYVPGHLSDKDRTRLRKLLQLYLKLIDAVGSDGARSSRSVRHYTAALTAKEVVRLLRQLSEAERPPIATRQS